MLDNSVTKPGVLLFKDGKIWIDGWELKTPGMCREHVIFACLHVAQELMKAATLDIASPGHDGTVGDMPHDTPIEWLCESTRRFKDSFDATDEPEQPFELLP